MRERFVTFEGGEGAGKSTQVRLLAEALRVSGHRVTVTREPGGSPLAERLRSFLLCPTRPALDATAEALLFAAARSDHMSKVILPALDEGGFVICDRFADSTWAYQGDGAGERLLERLHSEAVGMDGPSLTFLLDVDVRTGLARASARRVAGEVDRFEAEGLTFHTRLRERYLELADRHPDRIRIVDADRDAGLIAAEILDVVARRYPKRG